MAAGLAVAKSAAECLADGSFLVVFSDLKPEQIGDDMERNEISMDMYCMDQYLLNIIVSPLCHIQPHAKFVEVNIHNYQLFRSSKKGYRVWTWSRSESPGSNVGSKEEFHRKAVATVSDRMLPNMFHDSNSPTSNIENREMTGACK